MKKFLLSSSVLLLFLTSASLFKPPTVAAAEGGPAGKLMLRAVSGPKAAEVTLFWDDVQAVDNFHLVYGTDSKNMKYGVLNIGTSKVYTVKKLNPGTKYYFALVPVLNNVALYTSEWVGAWAGGGAVSMPPPVAKVVPTAPVVSQPVTKVAVPVAAVVPAAGPVGKHWLVARPGPKVGEVTLTWRHMDDANNYHLVYGTEHGKFKYGALNLGWVTKFTVGKLAPGVTYHFALVPVKNDVALYTTDQVMAATYRPVQVVTTTPDAVMQPAVPSVQGAETSVLPEFPSASGQ